MRSLKSSEWLGLLLVLVPSEYITAFSILLLCLNFTVKF